MFSDSDRSEQRKGGGEEGRTKGVSFRGTRGLLFAEKQVGWVVMREDSWQVQRRLTAKRRWQRGITEELSWGSLCDIFVDSFLVVRSFFGGVMLGSFVLERLQKINIGFKASKSTFWISPWTFLCQRFGYFTWGIYVFFVFLSLLFLTGLKWTELTWQKLSHISVSAAIRILQHFNELMTVVGIFACVFSTVDQIQSNLIHTLLEKQINERFWLLNFWNEEQLTICN